MHDVCGAFGVYFRAGCNHGGSHRNLGNDTDGASPFPQSEQGTEPGGLGDWGANSTLSPNGSHYHRHTAPLGEIPANGVPRSPLAI